MTGRDIIIVSTQDFDDLWTRKQRWAQRLARENRVLYIESQVHWLTVLKSLRRSTSRLSVHASRLREVSPNLWIWTPPIVFPFFQMWRPINRINNRLLAWLIRRLMRRLHFSAPILWLYTPYSSDLIDELRPANTVYECVDDFAAAKGLVRRSLVRRMEDDTFRRADLTVVTSEPLTRHADRVTSRWRLSPNACDVPFFASAADRHRPCDTLVKDLPRPIYAFVGALAYWVDLDLLAELARLNPTATVLLVGPVRVDVSRYRNTPNMRFAGQVAYKRLPDILRGADVCLNPYRGDDLSLGASPLKLYEYLATGKPVVSTPMPAAEEFSVVVRIASDPRGFAEACHDAATESDDRLSERETRQRSLIARHTWEERFVELEQWVDDLLAQDRETVFPPAPRRVVFRKSPESHSPTKRFDHHVVINALSLTGPQLGGGFTYLTSLLPEMIGRHPETQFTVLLTRSASKYVNPDFDNLTLRLASDCFCFGPARAWYERHHMAGVLRQLAADVYFLPYGFLPRNCPCPAVMTFQNLYFLHAREYPQWQPPSMAWRVYENIREREYLRHLRADLLAASRIVAISAVAKRELVGRCEIPAERIHVAGLAAAPEFAPTGDLETDSRRRASVGVTQGYILSVGALAPNKNIDRLLDAYQALVQHVESCPELVIAGPDWRGLSRQVRAMIASYGLTRRVRLLGLVDSATLASLYRGTVATVQLSDCEAFGLPAIEAMASGSPTIVADRSGLAEVGGDGAIQVDPFDPTAVMLAMHTWLTDRSSREEWKRRALVRAAQFNWRRTADITFDAIAAAAGWAQGHQHKQVGFPTDEQRHRFLVRPESNSAHGCRDGQPRQHALTSQSLTSI